jgi:L-fucose mutarotase
MLDMLRGISPLISPQLLETLHRMGHHDEIIFGDAHFPGESKNKNVIRADGLGIEDLLQAILPLFVLDHAVPHPVVMMEPVGEDRSSQVIMESYQKVRDSYSEIIHFHNPKIADIEKIEKFDFYKRAENAFTVVMTGDLRIYANLLLVKGVTTWES